MARGLSNRAMAAQLSLSTRTIASHIERVYTKIALEPAYHRVMEAFSAWGDYDRDDPFPLFADVRARGSVHQVTLVDGHAAWLIVGYDEARAALNDPRFSKDMQRAMSADVVAEGLPGPALARHMLAVDPPDHTRLRRLVSGAFSVRRIDQLRPRIQNVVDDLLDEIATSTGVVDLVAAFAFPLPFSVICDLLGVPGRLRPTLGAALRGLLSPTPDRASSDSVVWTITELVDAKRTAPADDLVSDLIRAGQELTGQELLSTIFQLLVAGHDTTTSLIGNGVVALLRHPDQLAALRSDPALLAGAIEELLRYDAPVPHSTFRYTTAAVDIGDITIPPGAQVIISLAAANRDGRQFGDAETLDICRADVRRHLAFGHGIHFCLGAPLARVEGHIALGSFLRRCPQVRLAVEPDELRWGHGDGLVLRGLTTLPVLAGRVLPRSE